MAACTHARQPGMLAFPSPGSGQGSVSGMNGEKPKKKAFYLVRMKPLKEPATNNNVSFVLHCHIGKEIKHICSNCSRGEEARDGECGDAVGVGASRSVCAGMGCACVLVCAPLTAWDRGVPCTEPREAGERAQEERTGHRFSLSIGGVPIGTGPLICHRSFVLAVKEPTLFFSFFFFSFFFSPSCYRNCCVY